MKLLGEHTVAATQTRSDPEHSTKAASTGFAAPSPADSSQGHAGWTDVLQQARHVQIIDALDAVATAKLERQWLLPPHHWALHPQLLSGCEPERAPLRVALLLSGGVDSSVALRLAQEAGHEVTAFYLQIWFVEDFRNTWDSCPWETDLSFCKEVCKQAGLPLEVVPMSEAYWARVVSHSVAEVRAGRTPNPDVLCNSRVKFGAFLEHLEASYLGRFDRIATGHYAAVSHDAGGHATLSCTGDAVKDQTYFLAHLTQVQLARCMFPLGPLTKAAVRQLARAASLPTQSRPDSQGICFLGKVRYSEFVKEHLGEWPGPLIDADTNSILGFHSGFWFHTIGQRKGVPLNGGPWYVVAKNVDRNAVYISRTHRATAHLRNGFRCGPFNWLAGTPPDSLQQISSCKVRHGEQVYRCSLRFEELSQAAASEAAPAQAASSQAAPSQAAPSSAGAQSDETSAEDSSDSGPLGGIGGRLPATSATRAATWGSSWDYVSDGRGALSHAVVALDGQDPGMAPGQYAVFYDGDVCLASAVITETLNLRTEVHSEHILQHQLEC